MGLLDRLFHLGNDEDTSYEQNSAARVQGMPFMYDGYSGRAESEYMMSVYGDSSMPYTLARMKSYMRNPSAHIKEIRRMAHWAYQTNGVVSSAVDYMVSLYTLDGLIVRRNRGKKGKERFKDNRVKMRSALDTIGYKRVIRDALFRNLNDGMYVGYFESRTSNKGYGKFLSSEEFDNVSELGDFGTNASIFPLPLDYVKIVGTKNNSYQVSFDLSYFDDFDETALKLELMRFPAEIQSAWVKHEQDPERFRSVVLDNNKTIVTKIKADSTEGFGIPFSIAALDDIAYAEYFTTTKRKVLDTVNNQIIYQTFPEGERKGTSALSQDQQKTQHGVIHSALQSRSGGVGTAFFSLAPGTKLSSIDTNVSLLDEKNEKANIDAVNKDVGVSAAALDGSSTGNFATANLNIDLVASNVYTWIEDIVKELNKCINKNIIKDDTCRVDLYIMPVTLVNRKDMVGYMSELYSQGKGSLMAWIAATGFNPEYYISLMDEELEEDFEDKYPVHKTSFTASAKDDKGGRPPENSNSPASVQGKTNGANSAPKPSGQ